MLFDSLEFLKCISWRLLFPQIVQKLTNEGASVLAIDINTKENEATASSCTSNKCHAFTADITLESSWRDILSTALSKFSNRLDVVVNCAGVVHIAAPSHEVPEDQFDLMFKVNVKPLYLSNKVIVPWFRENKIPGLFINMSSISEPRPRPNVVWYAGSKGAVTVVSIAQHLYPLRIELSDWMRVLMAWKTKITKGLAAEYAADQIRFNCIRPAVGETAM